MVRLGSDKVEKFKFISLFFCRFSWVREVNDSGSWFKEMMLSLVRLRYFRCGRCYIVLRILGKFVIKFRDKFKRFNLIRGIKVFL